MTLRKVECAGGCSKTKEFEDPPGQQTVEAWCEPCYVRENGEPAWGFVGYFEGWFRVVGLAP